MGCCKEIYPRRAINSSVFCDRDHEIQPMPDDSSVLERHGSGAIWRLSLIRQRCREIVDRRSNEACFFRCPRDKVRNASDVMLALEYFEPARGILPIALEEEIFEREYSLMACLSGR